MSEKQPTKRQFVKAVGAAGLGITTGLAGCTGGDQAEGTPSDGTPSDGTPADGTPSGGTPADETSTNDFWPPPRSIVESIAHTNPGGTTDIENRFWAQTAGKYYPDNVRVAITNRPGAQGQIGIQDVYSGARDGSVIGTFQTDALFAAHSSIETLNILDFNFIVTHYTDLWALYLNHNSLDLETHAEWGWSEIVEAAKNKPFQFASVIPNQTLVPAYLWESHPELTEDDLEFVNYPSGSDVRAAMLRGDVDGYMAGIGHAYANENDEFYKAQIVIGDPEESPGVFELYANQGSHDGMVDGFPESAWLVPTANDSSFPVENAKSLSSLIWSGTCHGAPPDTPEEIMDIHTSAFEEAASDPELENQITESIGSARFIPSFDVESWESRLEASLSARQDDQLWQDVNEKYFG